MLGLWGNKESLQLEVKNIFKHFIFVIYVSKGLLRSGYNVGGLHCVICKAYFCLEEAKVQTVDGKPGYPLTVVRCPKCSSLCVEVV